MRIFLDTVNRRLLAVTNILAILAIGPCAILAPRQLAAQEAEAQPAKLDPATLDNVVARIALYPDPLLAQVMAAASFAEQLSAATQWAVQHKNLKGDALSQATGVRTGARIPAALPARAATCRRVPPAPGRSPACRMAGRNKQPRRAGKPAAEAPAAGDDGIIPRGDYHHAKKHTFS